MNLLAALMGSQPTKPEVPPVAAPVRNTYQNPLSQVLMSGISKQREDPFRSDLQAVSTRYPRLKAHLDNTKVQWGEDNGGDRQLEFYPPWEGENPNPGKVTIELYNRALQGQQLQDAIAGDSLHLLGAINPETSAPVDPTYYALKQRLIQSRTPRQYSIDKNAYQEEMRGNDNPQEFSDWVQRNRGDAYIRGYLTPDANDEWRKSNMYSDEQKKILEQMRILLMTK